MTRTLTTQDVTTQKMSIPRLPPVRNQSQKSLVTFDNEVDPLTKHELFENGRVYILNDSNVQHQLPAPTKLRPYIDRTSGEVDTWPAHLNALSSTNDDGQQSFKPKFLLKLEGYLQKELRALGCTDDAPSERRLQAFREVFQYLIEDFKTYKPLLSVIKNEYEAMLNAQNEEIRTLEPLKAMLVNVHDQCEQKVLSLKQEEKSDVHNLKNENERLQSVIASLRDEIAGLQAQVRKCQDEVAYEYQRYRDESDARKLLIQDINDLKYQQEETKRVLLGGADEAGEGEKEDSVMLRIALRKAREDLDSKTQRLAEVMADYGDVIPRRDFEKLESRFKAMETEHDVMKKDHESLLNEHSTLIGVHKKVIEQRDNFALDCERMRRSGTPRPDWDKCAMYIEGGVERWNELSKETSTNDKVDILLAEITGQDINVIKNGGGAMVDFFEPKGIEDTIPKYLQSSERVRNRRLSKRDLCISIKDVWQEKIKAEGSTPFTDHSPMDEFLYEYLQRRFSIESMTTEWAYNIHDALTRYSADSHVNMFASVLNKELDEDVYYSHLNQLEELYHMFMKADENDTGILSKEDFSRCLSSYFTSYTPVNLASIVTSVEEELGDSFTEDKVTYRDLFTEDDEGKSGPFITCLQRVSTEERKNYLAEIEESLHEKEDVTIADLRQLFFSIDPKLDDHQCDKYTKLAFRSSSAEEEILKLSTANVMENLRRSCIKRT